MNSHPATPTFRLFAALACLPASLALAQTAPDFTELSLTELMQVKVTSVSRKEQALSDAPASVAVITGDDIHQLGATTLASTLRLCPGMQVARIDGHEYAVSARGFNDLYSNKLLVLVDGRTIYNLLFSGVFWNQNTVFLGDVDRVEVIRGPGSTQWGTNAVNGVVSINSKSAFDTLGSYVGVVTGSQTTVMAEARQGVKIGEHSALRVYVKEQQEDDLGIDVIGATHGWRTQMAGMRLDWAGENDSSFTWITEGRETKVDNYSTSPQFTAPYHTVRPETYRIGNFSSNIQWKQSVGETGKISFRGYYDLLDRSALKFGEDRNIFDLDGQMQFSPLPGHELMLGMGYRQDDDEITPSIAYGFTIPKSSSKIFNTFVQDEVVLVPDKLKLSAGCKFEKGSMFGWEPQPSLRLMYTPTPTQSLWASATRAARSPSRSERNLRFFHTSLPPSSSTGGLPTAVFLTGTPKFKSENLKAFELGYRAQPRHEFSYECAVFLNCYTDLRDINLTYTGYEAAPQPHVSMDSYFTNDQKGCTYGAELSANWSPMRSLRFQATFSTLRYDLEDPSIIPPYPAAAYAGSSPRHQATLRMTVNPIKKVQLDLFASYRDRLSFLKVPSYVGLDARLAWHPTKNLELAVTGMDLTDPKHPEFGAYFLSGPLQQLSRSWHASATLHF